MAAGDLNGDGHTDLVTANVYGNVSVLLGDGSGGFAPAGTMPPASTPTSVVLGDFTGDGKLDVATANSSSNTVSVLYGNGDGTFSPRRISPQARTRLLIAAGDFNGDGWLDAATRATAHRRQRVSVLINDHSWPIAVTRRTSASTT